MIVDRNRIKGNYAANLVAAWLSRRCLVRPVAEGTDIGIDFYCESVVSTMPFLHFLVQVKAIPARNLKNDRAWYQFETRHLRYWQRQPIPAYSLLVPITGWPPETTPSKIWIVRISQHLAQNGLPQTKSLRLTTGEALEAANLDQDVEGFISTIVPQDTALILLSKGIVAPVPYSDGEMQRFLWRPKHYDKHVEKIANSVQYAILFGGFAALAAEKKDARRAPIRRMFECLAKAIPDRLDFDGVLFLLMCAAKDSIRDVQWILDLAKEKIEHHRGFSPEEKAAKIEGLSAQYQEYLTLFH